MTASPNPTPKAASTGVEQLIARLRDQGVQAGKTEGAAIVEAARTEAEDMLLDARKQADDMIEDARSEAQKLENAGKEALRIAARDTILRFQEELMDYFNERVRRLVSEQMEDREMLGRLVVEVAAATTRKVDIAESDELEVFLPPTALGMEELKRNPEEITNRLTQLVKSIAGTTWREGVTFKTLEGGANGIRVHVKGKDLDIELTEEAVAEVLLEHMQPRFRAIMQGIIR